MKKSHFGASLAIAAGLLVGGMTVAAEGGVAPGGEPTQAADTGAQDSGPSALSSNCKKTFTSGVNLSRFSWCFSNDGNIVKMEHSSGIEHIRNGSFLEGFCLSSNNVQSGRSEGDNGNFGLNAPTYPSATKVRHTTTDGRWAIEQTFSQNTGAKTATVSMKLTNTSGVVQSQVFLTRWVDADIAGDFSNNIFVNASRSTAAMLDNSARLELLPDGVKFPTNSMIFASPVPSLNQFCYDPVADAATTFTTDGSMGLLQQLPNVLPGGSTTAKFTYRVSI
jgi:hypothetical protein